MVALIATDLDGTFLGADKMPSAENTEAILAAADVGVHVVFATGRPYRWLTVLDPFRPPIHPTLLASNGAVSVEPLPERFCTTYTWPRRRSPASSLTSAKHSCTHCSVPRRPPNSSPKKGSTLADRRPAGR